MEDTDFFGNEYDHLYYHGKEERLGIERSKKATSALKLAGDALGKYESHELKEDWAKAVLDYNHVQEGTGGINTYPLEPRQLLPQEEPQSPSVGIPHVLGALKGAIQEFYRKRLIPGRDSSKETSAQGALLRLKQWQGHNLHPDDLKDLSEMWLYRESYSLHDWSNDWSKKTMSSVQGVMLRTTRNYQLGGKLVMSTSFGVAMTRAEMNAILACIQEINDKGESIYENYLQAVVVSISQTAARILHAHLEVGNERPKLQIVETGPWHFSDVDETQDNTTMRQLTAAMMALPNSSTLDDPETAQIPQKLRVRFLQTAHNSGLVDRETYADELLDKYVDIDHLEHLIEKKPVGSNQGLCACFCDEEPRLKGSRADHRKDLKEYKKNYPRWCEEERHFLNRVNSIMIESRCLDLQRT